MVPGVFVFATQTKITHELPLEMNKRSDYTVNMATVHQGVGGSVDKCTAYEDGGSHGSSSLDLCCDISACNPINASQSCGFLFPLKGDMSRCRR